MSPLLLIEDDEVAAYLTLKAVTACGFKSAIDIVKNGVEAMEYLNRQGAYVDRDSGNPSLILLDLRLPLLSGFEVLKQIRTTPTLSAIPVFILSASTTERDIYRSSLLGVSKYLVKPLDMDEFKLEALQVLRSSNIRTH